MTALQVLGVLLLASPFVAIAAFTIYALGWRACAASFGLALSIIAVTGVGAYLLTGGK